MGIDDPKLYGERIAGVYDRLYGMRPGTAAAVDFLEQLARGGPVLELAIGTGRIAIPLTLRNIRVDGVDISAEMVERLRAKPGGDAIAVTMGNIADVPVEGAYRLIYLVFNTIFALLTQEEQVRCFRNVAAHLDGDGVFVIEAFVPDLSRYRGGQHVGTTAVEADHVLLDVSRHHSVTQRIDSTHVHIGDGGVQLFPVALRYAWPSELDLMARLAGLRLRERWGGWNRESFDDDSGMHVSVYER